MRLSRIVPIVLAVLALLALAPSANACIQVYPWSELCQGDYQGFLDAILPLP